jgi:hypothetical protein
MPEPLLVKYVIGVGVGLTVAALSALVGYFFRGERDRKQVGEAPFLYVKRLDELIRRALHEGAENAVINARAIVAARNSLARSLVSISSSLDSQIDRLAEEIGEAILTVGHLSEESPKVPLLGSTANQKAYDTIKVLARIWPAKRSQIIVEVRKILAELNIPFETKTEDRFEKWWTEEQPQQSREVPQ